MDRLKGIKMSRMLKKRRLEWLDDNRYNLLTDDEKRKLKVYRNQLRLCRLRFGRIERHEKKLDILKDEYRDLLTELTGQLRFVDYLQKKLEFSCYVVPLKRKSGKTYYNISVSRKGTTSPKSISLGTKDDVKKHLLEYYVGNSIILRGIKTDWISWMKIECKRPTRGDEERIVYNRISELIIENPLTFKNIQINRHSLFPLKDLI